MKQGLIIPILLIQSMACLAQFNHQASSAFEQQMELQAEEDDAGDAYQEVLNHYIRNPLNLNQASEDDLKEMILLSALQIRTFLVYRALFGHLVNIYELQAVPLWDLNTIQQLIPYVRVNDANGILETFSKHGKGKHTIVARMSTGLEKARGFQGHTADSSSYLGSQNRLYLRYRYNENNRQQWGMLADKDAGEQIFRGTQKRGFDFYSMHLYLKTKGIIKALALGDYTVNMGQGLIHWQTMAFKKNADITKVKRESPVLRPYTSAGEFNFHRGLGITFQKKQWDLTCFFSYRNHSSNLSTDSLNSGGNFSSIITTGYHRTLKELASRNNLSQLTAGGSLKYTTGLMTVAMNTVMYQFSRPMKRSDQPGNQYALRGNSLFNNSIDYSYTYKNVHLFGEAALDHNGNRGFLNGLMVAPDKVVNVSIVHRFIDKDYQALYANAFTENTAPTNENGLFAGLAVKPSHHWNIEAYMDVFKFPWLKYRVDAPSSGKEYFVQVRFTPNKYTELYTRFKMELKAVNQPGDDHTTRLVSPVLKQNWRLHTSININRNFQLRNRCEVTWHNRKGPTEEEGFLIFTDLLYKPPLKWFSSNMRVLYFETDGYNSRMYAFESNLMTSYSVPAVFGRGTRYAINIKADLNKLIRSNNYAIDIEVAAGFSQIVYKDKAEIGSGMDMIEGERKSGLQFQVLVSF